MKINTTNITVKTMAIPFTEANITSISNLALFLSNTQWPATTPTSSIVMRIDSERGGTMRYDNNENN